MDEAAAVHRELTANGASAHDATLALCEQFPGIAELWRVCTGVYVLAGSPYGDDLDSMVRWYDERRG
jgi:hypothetical protein